MTEDYKPVREGEGYDPVGYDRRDRFISYWHQIDILAGLAGRNQKTETKTKTKILETGPGHGFMTDYLRKAGFDVLTLDIDDRYRPDHIGSVDAIPLSDNSVNIATAFQVLEHLPFDRLKPALEELSRVADDYVVISLPDVRWLLKFDLAAFSPNRSYRKLLSFPRLIKRQMGQTEPGGHLWEIGRAGYGLTGIWAALPRSLTLLARLRLIDNPYHHFFVFGTVK